MRPSDGVGGADPLEQQRMAQLLAAYWADPETTWRRIDLLQRHARPSQRLRTADAVMQRLGQRQRRRSARWPLAAVAALVLCLLGWWTVDLLRPVPAWSIGPTTTAAWTPVGDGGTQRLGEGPLPVGDGVLEAGPEPLALRSDHGLQATLAPGSRLRWSATTSTGEGPELLRGQVAWSVTPRPVAWSVATPLARVTVLGTRFIVGHDDAGSVVRLHSGSVRVERCADGARVRLEPGESLRCAAASVPLQVVTAAGWYRWAAERYAAGAFLLEDDWQALPAQPLSLTDDPAQDDLTLAEEDGVGRSWTGPALPEEPALEIRWSFAVDTFLPGAFSNLYGMGTEAYAPQQEGLPTAFAESLDARGGWREHRVRLLQVGELPDGTPIHEIEARIDGRPYVRAWRSGALERVVLVVRSFTARLRHLEVARLVRRTAAEP